MLNTTIKQYELPNECITVNEEIGEGFFGKVYKGAYKPQNCDETTLVAIKMIKNETLDDKEFLYDFDREIKILSKLDHRNIIKFLGVVRLDANKLVFSMVSKCSM